MQFSNERTATKRVVSEQREVLVAIRHRRAEQTKETVVVTIDETTIINKEQNQTVKKRISQNRTLTLDLTRRSAKEITTQQRTPSQQQRDTATISTAAHGVRRLLQVARPQRFREAVNSRGQNAVLGQTEETL